MHGLDEEFPVVARGTPVPGVSLLPLLVSTTTHAHIPTLMHARTLLMQVSPVAGNYSWQTGVAGNAMASSMA